MESSRRIFLRRFSLSALLVASLPASAHGHAALVSSFPARGESVSNFPKQFRLVFSEPVEGSMSSLSLHSTTGAVIPLTSMRDPQHAHVVIAGVGELLAGGYEIRWKVMTADGHTITGTVPFQVASVNALPNPAETGAHAKVPQSDESANTDIAVERAGMLLRGIGMAALMAFAGLIFFGRGHEAASPFRYLSLASALSAIAAGALSLHFIIWASQATPPGTAISAFVQSGAGKREGLRTALTLLAFSGWWLAGRPSFASVLAWLSVIASAFIGHAAAINPGLSIPFKLAHLIAVAIWGGGLLWLVILDRAQRDQFIRQAGRVSTAAGICALVALISGIVQTGTILSWDPHSLTSGYAIIAALKLGGFLIIAAMGAYNRFRLLPGLDVNNAGPELGKMVFREIWLLFIVALLGGVLAYTSPPGPPPPTS